MALNLGIQTDQILTNDDEVCIPSHNSVLLAVHREISYIIGSFHNFLHVSVYFDQKMISELRYELVNRWIRGLPRLSEIDSIYTGNCVVHNVHIHICIYFSDSLGWH